MRLAGKHIVVTGGSGGVGSVLIEKLLAAGASVTALGRKQISDRTGLLNVAAELGKEAGLRDAAAQLERTKVDVLVNLAGEQYFGLFDEQEPIAIIRSYHVNLIAAAVLTRAVLPAMKAARTGHIVFAGSVFGAIPFAHFSAYSSAKAGLAALTLALSRENYDSGIEFTCAVPRAIRTNMASERIRKFATLAGFKFDEPDQVAERLYRVICDGKGKLGPGFPESLFMRIHGLAPSLVSKSVHGTNVKARSLLSPR